MIAIDVILKPPISVIKQAIAANRRLTGKYCDHIRLSRQHTLPHISMTMAVVDKSKLADISTQLETQVLPHLPLTIAFTRQHTKTGPEGRRLTEWLVQPTPVLQALHEAAMEVVKPYHQPVDNPDILHDTGAGTSFSVQWVNNFQTQAAYDQFIPHLTIGMGQLPEKKMTLSFRATTLGCYHLGDYCTCQRKLWERSKLAS